ncbi:hypothetical protein ACIQUU_31955 [Streptomyces sp. NPDC101116]|uniref:hypothetical protein n=1 Tax=Streptomyces sp. NPDC101116 TaxID=3366107 RepID=UPI003821DD15
MQLSPATVDRLAELFAAGASNKAARRELGIDVSTAARYRTKLGFGAAPQPAPNRSPLTLEQKWRTFARPVEGGHMQWTGRRRAGRPPAFTHHGREHTARTVAFRIATGRTPDGYVTAECDAPEWCVAPEHVADEPTRTKLRAALAVVIGVESQLTECTRGHDAATHRRYDRDGRPYCGTCHALTHTRRAAA